MDTRDTLSQEMCPISWLPSMERVSAVYSPTGASSVKVGGADGRLGLLSAILVMLRVGEWGGWAYGQENTSKNSVWWFFFVCLSWANPAVCGKTQTPLEKNEMFLNFLIHLSWEPREGRCKEGWRLLMGCRCEFQVLWWMLAVVL